MRFNVSTRHVRAAYGEGTTVYVGTIYVNGEVAARDGNAELCTDRSMGGMLWEHVVPFMERKLGRRLTEEEQDRLNADVEAANDGSTVIREDEEHEFEVGPEPGGGGTNPEPEFVPMPDVRPSHLRILRALVGQVAMDDPELWIAEGEDPGLVAELAGILGVQPAHEEPAK